MQWEGSAVSEHFSELFGEGETSLCTVKLRLSRDVRILTDKLNTPPLICYRGRLR